MNCLFRRPPEVEIRLGKQTETSSLSAPDFVTLVSSLMHNDRGILTNIYPVCFRKSSCHLGRGIWKPNTRTALDEYLVALAQKGIYG